MGRALSHVSPRRAGSSSEAAPLAAVGRLHDVKRFSAPGHFDLTKRDPTGARGRLTNQSGGLRSFVRAASAGKFIAVKSLHPAQLISSLGVRTTVHPGPSNSLGFAPGAFIRFRKKPQNEGGCNRPDRSHRAVSFLRHWSASSCVHTTHERAAPFLGTRHTQAGAVA